MKDPVLYTAQGRAFHRRVFYTGDDAVAQGIGLCYNRDVGTAASLDETRDKYVQKPDNTNNNSFAGVTEFAYAAITGGQWVQISEPGSVVRALIDVSGVIGDAKYVTCHTGTGAFGLAGFTGRGSAKLLQTIDGSSTAALCLVELMDGVESGLVEVIQAVSATAVTPMVGGVSRMTGGITIATDSTATLANGTILGQRKAIYLIGALTTGNYVVTVTSGLALKPAGTGFDGWQTLASLTFDDIADYSNLEWNGVAWLLTSNVGTVAA